jgi:c-di-GMP-binding flagellar brake protein YcgR
MDMLLIPGEKINIHLQNLNNPEQSKTMHSRVINLDSEFYYIRFPIFNGVEYPLRIGQKFKVVFYRDSGMYSFSAKLVQKVKDQHHHYYQITAESELTRTERRVHIRIDLSVKGNIKSMENNKSCEIMINNLSGGGMSAVCDQAFYRGERIECTFNLDEQQIVTAAEVIRVHRVNDEKRYQMGIQFQEMSQENRNLTNEYIFKKKVDMGKKQKQ